MYRIFNREGIKEKFHEIFGFRNLSVLLGNPGNDLLSILIMGTVHVFVVDQICLYCWASSAHQSDQISLSLQARWSTEIGSSDKPPLNYAARLRMETFLRVTLPTYVAIEVTW